MAHLFTDSMQSDGINFTLLHMLWVKHKTDASLRDENSNEESNDHFTECKKKESDDDDVVTEAFGPVAFDRTKETAWQIPDTIIFQFGQPIQWYFTSKKNKGTKILRKRKQNLTVEKIEEVFLHKTKVKNNGWLDSKDIVAYFIETAECTARHQSKEKMCWQMSFRHDLLTTREHDYTRPDKVSYGEGCCNIEYFDSGGLKHFLGQGRKTRSGILQFFIEPSGGGTNNSQIKVIWTKKLFFIERRITKRELHDSRFSLYERAVTFEGPEVHSITLPIRGSVLSMKVRNVCDSIVKHINYIVGGRKKKTSKKNACRKEITRMVLHFKMDTNDQLWLLYSSSIRLTKSSSQESIWKGFHEKAKRDLTTKPLNIENLVKLPLNIRLNQHSTSNSSQPAITNSSLNHCPSCLRDDSLVSYYPVPYKTIICHFEKVTSLMKDEKYPGENITWPPDPDIIRSGSGIGFGPLLLKISCKTGEFESFSSCNAPSVYSGSLEKEDYIIPPVLRYIHKKLKVNGYRRYRSDPFFLHKECNVCETCFLSYAQLASSSFQMTQPIRLFETSRCMKIKQVSHRNSDTITSGGKGGKPMWETKKSLRKKQPFMRGIEEGTRRRSPSFPLAVTSPNEKSNFEKKTSQKVGKSVSRPPPERNVSLSEAKNFETMDDDIAPLCHLVKVYERLQNTTKQGNASKKKLNPYIIPLRLPKDTSIKTKKMIHGQDERNELERINHVQTQNNTYLSICEEDINILTSTLDHIKTERTNGHDE